MKMTTTTHGIKASSGLKVKSCIKAAGLWMGNHNRSGLKVKSGVKEPGSRPRITVAVG